MLNTVNQLKYKEGEEEVTITCSASCSTTIFKNACVKFLHYACNIEDQISANQAKAVEEVKSSDSEVQKIEVPNVEQYSPV